MHISSRSAFLRWSKSDGATSRTAVYGPVRTVVWQGSVGDRRPYADQQSPHIAVALRRAGGLRNLGALFLSRTSPDPGGQVLGGGKYGRASAHFGDNLLRRIHSQTGHFRQP